MASNFRIKANDGKGFFRQAKGEFGFNLSDSLLRSEAYRTLTPAGKVVLIDMLKIYFRLSSWESTDISSVGFQYAFAVCDAGVSEHTFQRARKEIIEHGFFSSPEKLQTLKACSAIRFVAVDKWRTWTPSAKKAADLRKAHAARERRLERTRENRRKAVDQLASGRFSKKKQGPKMEAITTARMEAIQNGETPKTPRHTAKMEAIKCVSRSKNGGHYRDPYATFYGLPSRECPDSALGRVKPLAARSGRGIHSKVLLPLLGFLEPADPNLSWPQREFEEVAI